MNRRLATALPVGLLALVLLAGCTAQADTLANQYRAGSNSGYVSGDGLIVVLPTDKRTDPVTFSGSADDGSTISNQSLAGQVVVINFWYATCPPCRVEAPDLAKLATEYGAKGVQFVGVNVSDSADVARVFESTYGIPYPSILDVGDNGVQLAFASAGSVAPNAVPTTLVLDRSGRVAARFSGLISSPSVVASVLDDTLAEAS